MTYTTFLPNYYSNIIKQQQSTINGDNVYFYVADGVPQSATANTNIKSNYDELETLNQILYGGKVKANNIICLIRRINWVSGKVFEQYNGRDPNLSEKDFYCITVERNVYKCLNNNGGVPSTFMPTTQQTGRFRTADGYVWQFMYNLSSNELIDYSVQNYMPCIVNSNVQNNAVRASLSSIEVLNGGNYETLSGGYVSAVQSNTLVSIVSTALPINNIYTNMGFYISSGTGEGSLSQITQYTANTSGRWVTLNPPLINVGIDSVYEIAPFVKITGNGTNATARAVMNGSTVKRVDILNPGVNYTHVTATLQTNTSYNTAGTLLVNPSPVDGHGGDIYTEFFASAYLINIDLDGYVINNMPRLNDIKFSKIGTIKNIRKFLNESEAYTANSYNNTFMATVTPTFGNYSRGDVLKPVSVNNPTATIVFANTTHVVGVYESQTAFFANNSSVINQNGLTGIITSISQPEVSLKSADIISQVNINSIKRTEASKEILQLLVKIK